MLDSGSTAVLLALALLAGFAVEETGCIRRSEDEISEDYDAIDRSDPPVFVNNTRTRVAVARGRTARIECRVSNLGDRAVSWIRKSDLHILTMGDVVYTNDRRYSVERIVNRADEGETTDGGNGTGASSPSSAVAAAADTVDWTLVVEDARVSDSGVYECQINTEPKRSKAFRLQVVVSNAQIVGGDRDVFVQHDSDISLVCRTLSSPAPPESVTWLKDGRRIDQLLARGGISVVTESRRRTSRLLVSKVTFADAGNYTCAPTNAKIDFVMVHVIQGADPRANVMANSADSADVGRSFLLAACMSAGFFPCHHF